MTKAAKVSRQLKLTGYELDSIAQIIDQIRWLLQPPQKSTTSPDTTFRGAGQVRYSNGLGAWTLIGIIMAKSGS